MGQFRKTTCSLHWGVLAAALALSPSSFTWFPRRKMKIIMIMIMMMMLPMQSWFRPEADPAVLLAWIETEEDLTAIHNAAKVWAFVGSLRHSEPLKLQLFAIFTRLSSCSVALITQENYYSINAYTILYHTIPYHTIQHLTFGLYLRLPDTIFPQNTNDYSITVSQEFANEFWKKELTQVSFTELKEDKDWVEVDVGFEDAKRDLDRDVFFPPGCVRALPGDHDWPEKSE